MKNPPLKFTEKAHKIYTVRAPKSPLPSGSITPKIGGAIRAKNDTHGINANQLRRW